MDISGKKTRQARGLWTDMLLLSAVCVWAFNFTAVKYGITHGFAPLAYSGSRYALAGLCFGAVTLQRERSLYVTRRDFLVLIGIGLLGVCLNQIAFVYALHLISASTVALVFGSGPALVAVIAHFSRSERLSIRGWLATSISLAGVALVVIGEHGKLTGNVVGVMLALAMTATWAIYSVAIGPLMGRYSSFRLNSVVTLVGSLPLLGAAGPQLAQEHWSQIGLLAWLSFAYTLVIGYLVTNTIWFVAIHRIGAPRAALYTNLQPFLGALFAFLVLSERLTLFQITGGVVIGAGIVIARKRRPVTAPPAE